MNRELVGEPGVSAFLKSLLRYLADIGRMERTYTTNLFYDPNPHLEKLKRKLASLQDVLVDGEARRIDEACVDEWMDDLKHLFYDLDDILDDIRRTLSVQPDGIDQVQFDFTLLRGSSNLIKDRLEEILSRTDELVDKSKDLGLRRGVGYVTWGKSGQATQRTLETSPEVEMSEIHGREEEKKTLVEKLLVANDNAKRNYDVLSIVGMGGLGKTTLAKLIFDDSDVVRHFDLKSWVCISNVFDVARATKELIENLGEEGRDQQLLSVLQKRLKDTIRNRRFLFVLDDVWSSGEWETMKVPFSSCASGSKVLVTTRNTKIAHALGNKSPYQLEGLDHEHCMAIFRDKAFVDDEEEHEKLILGEKIVEACGGVPLAVKVIGSMLEGAEEEKWLAVSESVDLWNMEYIKDGIHPAIRLSYHYLPASLKRCFEYLAIFPPDYKFDQDDVVRLWIAGGLVQEEDGRMVEDIGNEYYNDLKARSLIQENNMMHDIVQHLASVVSRKFCYQENSKEALESMRHAYLTNLNATNYEFLAQAPCLRTLIVEDGDELVLRNTILSCKMLRTLKIRSDYYVRTLSLGKSFIDKLKHIRYLTIVRSDITYLPDSRSMPDNLQFFDLNSNYRLENLPEKMNHLLNLRCLILSYSSISTLPESICALPKLQVLELQYCADLNFLPQDIGNLRRLQTLNLGGTSISSLPQSISALAHLQVLNLDECAYLKFLPKDIGKLRSLRTLDLSSTFISSLPESICSLCLLQVLKLVDCDSLKELPKDIGNLRSLRTLDLSGTFISSLPESICALCLLQVLKLVDCRSLKELPKDIGNLRSLRTLDLSRTFKSSLPESICALCQLQVLNLVDCCNLKELPKDIGNLRSLRTLAIKGSPISSVPESILNVTGLQHLLVDEHKQLPLHIGRLARLKELPVYHLGKKEGQRLGELSLMNRLGGKLAIASMENIGSVEEAFKADLKSKKYVTQLEFRWSQPGNDEEMEVKIMEALKPHHALRVLKFFNYGGDKFPDWFRSSNICLRNLRELEMEGLNTICELVNLEFVSLDCLTIKNCPVLRMVSMATPKLMRLYMRNCGVLEAASVQFLPSLSDKGGMQSIVSQFKDLICAYNIFEYFFDMLKATNSKWDNLSSINLSARGRRVASLPGGWPRMMECLQVMGIEDIPAGNFQFVADGDESIFPQSLFYLSINNCGFKTDRPPQHSYTINSDGKLGMEEMITNAESEEEESDTYIESDTELSAE